MKRTGKSAVYRVLTLVLCVIIAVGMIPMAYAAGTVAVKSNQPIYIDGNTVEMTAYNIGGNNYIKLRDVGAAIDFAVDWDSARRCVVIDTTNPYTPIPESTPAVPEAVPEPEVSEFPTPAEIIPGGTAVDYSLEANPEIFDNYYTREKYNQDRQRVLDTGTYVNWGTNRVPQSETAIYAADRFFESIAGKSDLEKVQAINDFLCAHLTYKKGVSFIGDDFWTGMAYGVCEDYSRMFQYLCCRAGLACDHVTGDVNGNRHSWNEVYIDGSWQFYDGTYSDSRKTIALGNTPELATIGRIYTDDSPVSTRYRKEVYRPTGAMK